MFGAFPTSTQTFIPPNPPPPPHRHSSKDNNTLKVFSQIQTVSKETGKPVINTGTITLRKSRLPHSIRSKSAGSITTTIKTLKEEKNLANSSRLLRQYTHRVSSVSPVNRKIEKRKSNASPIAFGRSISKERMFAEEKKKLEQNLPPCRKSVPASTNILRNPFLQSPDQVKAAVRSTYRSPSASEKYTTITTIKRSGGITSAGSSSAFSYTSNRTLKPSLKSDSKPVSASVAKDSISKLSTTALRSRSGPKIVKPVVVKSLERASRSTEIKSAKLKHSSNTSLARTSSTFSIDSTNSKKKSNANGKPVSITRSMSRSRDYIAVVPATITGQPKKKKPELKTSFKKKSEATTSSQTNTSGSEEREKQRENESFLDRDHSIRSENFFQHLFLRDLSPQRIQGHSLPYARTRIQEKALLWDTWPKKRETSTTRAPVYLSHKRAVSNSKFKAMEKEGLRQSRSLSPHRIIRGPKCVYYDHVSNYDAYTQLSDDDVEFGDERLTSINYQYEERSRSEPRSKTYMHEVQTEDGRSTIYGATRKERPFSPTKEIRSPSCRRIQSFKSQTKIPRSKSLNAQNRFHSLDSHIRSRSACSVDGDKYESHLDPCSHQRSEKFKDLNRFYSNVERVGQLERATSSTDVRPIRREDELIDFDIWKQVRGHERAERELNSLVGKLKQEEKEKDFLFRPKYAEDLKWDERADRGLRIKEKSVENLKEIFIEKSKQNELDQQQRDHIDASKDTYKPLWRGNSVLDVASNMVCKYNAEPKKIQRASSLKEGHESRVGLSTKLMSTLSKEQVSKIKNQLSEIYCNKTGNKQEQYIINVTEEQVTNAPGSLFVRSNSMVTKNDLLDPVLKRQQARQKSNSKEASASNHVHYSRVSRSADRYESKPSVSPARPPLTEDEKKKLLQQLGQEIRDKVQERRDKVFQPKETRGAIAAETAGLHPSRDGNQPSSVKRKDKGKEEKLTPLAKVTIEARCEAKYNRAEINSRSQTLCFESTANVVETSSSSNKKDLSNDTADNVKDKIVYFEKKREEEPEKIIYHAREDSSPDEDEVMRVVEENIKQRKLEQKSKGSGAFTSQGRSSSVSDFKEIFGEKEITRNLIELDSPPSERRENVSHNLSHNKNASNSTSVESVFRSRSISPIVYDSRLLRPYGRHTYTGEVEKIKNKFESLTYRPKRYNTLGFIPPRRIQSDPDLNHVIRHISPTKVLVKDHESGDVSWITHKFEVKNSVSRGRNRDRSVVSPIQKVPLKKDDRFMPHIDIISKTASLKQEISPRSPTHHFSSVLTGEVEKIRNKFESLSPDRLSLVGQMYTSSPDIRELKDITNHLTASWVAHRYPKPRDNARSPTSPEKGPLNEKVKKKGHNRPNSASPPRSRDFALLKPYYDIFADQNYDPKKHRPTRRYIPDKKNIEAEYLWRRLKRSNGLTVTSTLKPSVKFKGCAFIVLYRTYLIYLDHCTSTNTTIVQIYIISIAQTYFSNSLWLKRKKAKGKLSEQNFNFFFKTNFLNRVDIPSYILLINITQNILFTY